MEKVLQLLNNEPNSVTLSLFKADAVNVRTTKTWAMAYFTF
jgi:hypothetical protein